MKNLTTGSILKTITFFSFPFLVSFFLQTFYGMADLFIIGQFNGVECTTAVSIGSQVIYMLTVIIVGLTMGTTVLIGKALGAKNYDEIPIFIGNTILLFGILSIVLTFVLYFFAPLIAKIMSTPIEAEVEAIKYLKISFLGIPFITAYNMISAIFRGTGDSKSPMYFVLIACILNILLDYLFIGAFEMKASGAALGTILSQAVSVIVSSSLILNNKTQIKFSLKDLKLKKDVIHELLSIGFPVALQNGLIQVAFIVITVIANKRGLYDAAAVGIVEKIIGILFLIPQTMLAILPVLTAQNIGAGKLKRAKLTLFYTIIISVCWGILVSIITEFNAEFLVKIFVKDKNVILSGSQYIRSYIVDCILAGIHFCFSGYFYAFGLSNIAFAHNFLSIICVRIPIAYFASKYFVDTLFPMGLASPAGSMLSVIICVSVYIWIVHNPEKFKTQKN